MAETVSTVVVVVDLLTLVSSTLDAFRQRMYGNLKHQCTELQGEIDVIKNLHGNLNIEYIDTDLEEALRKEADVLKEINLKLMGQSPRRWMLHKRWKLKAFLTEKKKSLKKANSDFTRALSQCQNNNLSEMRRDFSSMANINNFGGTSPDSSESASTKDESDCSSINNNTDPIVVIIPREPPTCERITGLTQPHDVLTHENEIFILMDNCIKAYDMEGNMVKGYYSQGFKPFAAVFLDSKLYVTDKTNSCIMVFDQSLNYKQSFGRTHMTNPAGITSCEKETFLYVLTGRENESAVVAKFQSNGEFIRYHCHGQLTDPWYIKKNKADQFFISDFAKHCVYVYSSDFSDYFCIKFANHCRGMDVGNRGVIYVALRNPGNKDQYESIVQCNNTREKKRVELESSPVGWFWEGNKSLQFVRGLHYYSCPDKEFLMVVDPGNNRVKIMSIPDR